MMIRPLLKPVNALVSGYSFLTSSLTGRASISGMPLSAGIELTNYCNLKCRECLSGSEKMSRERGFMDLILFDKIITELKPYVFNLNLYFQGEPMLHPGFFSFLKRAGGIYTTVSTNGHFLSEENANRLATSGLNSLIISLDGLDQQTYQSYRVNGNIDLVLQGIKNVAEAKRKNSSRLKVTIQLLINRNNEQQIEDIKQYARAMKVNLRIKSMQIIDEKSFEQWLPSDNQYSRYEMKGGHYAVKSRLPDRCARLWFNPVITWDGKVLPCCFDKDGHHVMGDLNEDSFRDIWNGPKYRLFRKEIFTDRKIIEICRNCTSGLKGVKY